MGSINYNQYTLNIGHANCYEYEVVKKKMYCLEKAEQTKICELSKINHYVFIVFCDTICGFWCVQGETKNKQVNQIFTISNNARTKQSIII